MIWIRIKETNYQLIKVYCWIVRFESFYFVSVLSKYICFDLKNVCNCLIFTPTKWSLCHPLVPTFISRVFIDKFCTLSIFHPITHVFGIETWTPSLASTIGNREGSNLIASLINLICVVLQSSRRTSNDTFTTFYLLCG